MHTDNSNASHWCGDATFSLTSMVDFQGPVITSLSVKTMPSNTQIKILVGLKIMRTSLNLGDLGVDHHFSISRLRWSDVYPFIRQTQIFLILYAVPVDVDVTI